MCQTLIIRKSSRDLSFRARHIRNSDNTVKADAFIPHPHEELSVNRDKDATDQETWSVGFLVARKLNRTLRGRADALAATYPSQQLTTIAAPIPGNPNHVNVCNWPSKKPEQMLKAKEIAEKAKLLRSPAYLDETEVN